VPGAYVEDRFQWLQVLVARKDGQPSQLDALVGGPLRAVYEELRNIVSGGGPAGGTALVGFQHQATELQGPLQRWAAQIATGSSGITADSTRAGMSARWQANVLPFCSQATKDAYPFNRRSQADISLQDFTRLFAPGGLIDTFFQENLLQYVDTRARPWTWKPVNDIDLVISQAVLDQMFNASQIRDAFFAQGATPGVTFEITPEALDPNAAAILLEIDGQTIDFRHAGGQPRPVRMTWPGAVGLARVTIVPQVANSGNMLSSEGPWGWFRILDTANIRATNASDQKRVIFNVGGRTAIFRMRATSVLDPFALPALYEFSCPESF
jgi:type VI secretion system protein ImpL